MFNLGLAELSLVSQISFNIGAAFAGFWAIYQYIKNRRTDAVKWTQQLFEDFYILDHFNAGRNMLEYEYFDKVVPILRMRVVDRDILLTNNFRNELAELDKLLNYFEHLIYLEQSRVIHQQDRKVFFEYWFGLINEPNKGSLRRYLKKCGYERLAAETNTQADELVLVSSLFLDSPAGQQLVQDSEFIEDMSEEVFLDELENGAFKIGLLPNRQKIFRVENPASIRKIDDFFSFRRGEDNMVDLQRVCMQIGKDKKDVWVHIKYD